MILLLDSILMFSVEIVWYTMLMISLRLTIDINWEWNLTLLKLNRDKKEPLNIKFLLSMDTVLLRILWEVCLVYNLNLLKRI
jgi:hypothetical protein